MNFLETRHKLMSFLGICVNLLFFLVVYRLTEQSQIDPRWRFAMVCLFASLMTVCLFYWVQRLKGLLLGCSVMLILWLSYGVPYTLIQMVHLPERMEMVGGIVFGLILFALSTAGLIWPGMIKDHMDQWLMRKLASPDESSFQTATETAPEEDDKEDELVEKSSYQEYLTYKRKNGYKSKRYALDNQHPIIIRLRAGFGITMLMMGIICLWIGATAQDQALDALHSWVYWVTFAGCSLFFFGIGLLVFGLWRGLALMASALISMQCVYYAFRFMQYAWGVSNWLFWFVAILLVSEVGLSLVLLVRRLLKSRYVNVKYYKNDEYYVAFDMALEDVMPIEGYDSNVTVQLPLAPPADELGGQEFKLATRLAMMLHRLSVDHAYIFAGYRIEIRNNMYEACLYCKSGDVQRIEMQITRLCHRLHIRQVSMQAVHDEAWDHYAQVLYPDRYMQHEIRNGEKIAHLEKRKYNLDEPSKLLFFLTFPHKEDAEEFAKQIEVEGFTMAAIEQEDGKTQLAIRTQSRMGIHRINHTTRYLIDHAATFGGRFEDWELEIA